MTTRRRRWSAAEDQLVATATSAQFDALARRLGRTRQAIKVRRCLLRSGRSARQRVERAVVRGDDPGKRDWTERELAYLDAHVGIVSKAQLARALGRSENAITVKAQRRGLRFRQPQRRGDRPLCAREVADLLGISCAKTVSWWCRAVLLAGEQDDTSVGRGRRWWIARPNLYDFLRDYPWLYDARRIADPGLKRYALALSREEYLTTRQAAPLLFLANGKSVIQAIYRGDLYAVRRGNWLIPRSSIRAYQPPPLGPIGPDLAARRAATLARMGLQAAPATHKHRPVPLQEPPVTIGAPRRNTRARAVKERRSA